MVSNEEIKAVVSNKERIDKAMISIDKEVDEETAKKLIIK